MKRIIGLVAICVLSLGVSVRAQAPQEPPKPGPELKRVAYFGGNWKEAGTAHLGAVGGPEGKYSSTSNWAWMSGGFFMVAHMDMTTSMGASKALGVMGYDPESKMYTYQEFDSTGETFMAKGSVSGDTWTWNSESMMGGKMMKTRVMIKEVSKTEYNFKMESSQDGKTWATGFESTFTKAAAAPAK